MIKQMLSKEIKEYLKKNPKCVLLDVRTEEEWNQDGKPDGNKIGLTTYFLPIQFGDERIFNENFIQEFKNLNIGQDHEILTMCRSGGRSQAAAELLTKENYTCSNISDGFLGNDEDVGWINCDLPC
jgi:rhodanese-related sulfurtransferase